jgi:iron complex outermembrane receptor protein
MKALWKAALLAGCAWSACSVPALAQDTASPVQQAQAESENLQVDELVVTARRREETLKDVPISVSALSEERLEATGATDITALQQQTPNATVQVARGSNSTLISFIRGIGQQDPLWGFEPGVGLYIDDVYVARPQGAVLDIFDIQRIEVLRGPQGTLYGRNTIGGAIKYVTARVGSENELVLRGEYGTYNEINLLASGKARLSEQFAVSGAIASYERDGFGENLTTGAEHYNKDVLAYRASVEFTPSEDLFFRFAYDRVVDDSNARHGHRETIYAGATPGSVRYAVLDDVYDTQAGIGDKNRVETQGWSLTGEWAMTDDLTFKSITASREGVTDTVIDFDNTPLPTLDVPADYFDEQFTQEFQLQYTGERLQGVLGVYYLNGYAAGEFDTIAGNLGVAIAAQGKISTTSYSVFGDFSYDVTDALHISVGGRWTQDRKFGNVFRAFYLGATPTPFQGGASRPVLQLRTNYTDGEEFEKFTPRVSVSYDLTEAMTGYVSWSKGFKSGGWDMRGDAFLTPQTVNGYDPEEVDAYEVGLKGSLFDRRLSFSSALFYTKLDGQQVTTQVPVPTGIASSIDNVGSSKLWGAEFEGSAFLTSSLVANFAVGYLNAEFEEFLYFDPISRQITDIADTRTVQNAPEWTGFLGVTWTGDVAGGELKVTPSVSYRSSFHLFDLPDPILDQDGYALVDIGIIWEAPSERWQLGLFGRNLTDETYRVGGYAFPGATFANSYSGFYGPPRTVTARLQYRF